MKKQVKLNCKVKKRYLIVRKFLKAMRILGYVLTSKIRFEEKRAVSLPFMSKL